MTSALIDAPERAAAPDQGGRRLGELVERELASAVDGILNRHAAVGFGVGIVRDGRLEAFAGRGFANVATRTPISEDTVFRIASISKTFTAIAVMQLAEKGLVDLKTISEK